MGTPEGVYGIIETETDEFEDLLGERSRGDISREEFVKRIVGYLNKLSVQFIQADKANDNANLIEIRERLKEIYNTDSESLIGLLTIYFSAQKKIASNEANFIKIFFCCYDLTAINKTDKGKG